ncbi:MAG: efflux RND transporter permease subunit, partial [Armatimonadetes bacterium]|nr:efflux RND transporter permease subunit [Armatimonadota bacterium]
YLRRGPNVADLQVNLVNKHERKAASHAIAKRVRPKLTEIARKYAVQVTVAEVPPGPPVMQTLVAEVYGPDYDGQIKVARQIEEVFRNTPGVVDVDDYIEEQPDEYSFVVDKAKAQLNGVTTQQVVQTLGLALHGQSAGLAHIPTEAEPCEIFVRLPRSERSSLDDLLELRVMSPAGRLVPLRELVKVEPGRRDRNIYHKNLRPVVYVVGDVAGVEESPVYAILKMFRKIGQITTPDGRKLFQVSTHVPFYTDRYIMKWDGEWQITYEVFRDLGISFAVVMVLIYALVLGWFQNFRTPLTIMTVIPISLIGVLPAHAAMGAFFTATSMIGFIAGAGIVVRNSIILVDFIELRLRGGMSLPEACIDAGAVRFRPIFLTAAAVFVASSVILLDPIFQGMAVALMAGEAAALVFSIPTVPILYYLQERGKLGDGGGPGGGPGPQTPEGEGPEQTSQPSAEDTDAQQDAEEEAGAGDAEVG